MSLKFMKQLFILVAWSVDPSVRPRVRVVLPWNFGDDRVHSNNSVKLTHHHEAHRELTALPCVYCMWKRCVKHHTLLHHLAWKTCLNFMSREMTTGSDAWWCLAGMIFAPKQITWIAAVSIRSQQQSIRLHTHECLHCWLYLRLWLCY